jgi:hypothetical protein
MPLAFLFQLCLFLFSFLWRCLPTIALEVCVNACPLMSATFIEANSHIAALSRELWDYILNGADHRGRALLDPRFRFAVRMTCRLWRVVVSSPSEVDRRRIVTAISATVIDSSDVTSDTTGRMATGTVVCLSAMADVFAASENDSVLETLAIQLAPSTDVAVWRWRLIDAMAASGVDRHLDCALALADRESVQVCLKTGERVVHSYSAMPAYYRMCVYHGCARGADTLAGLLTLQDLCNAATDAARHDRPPSLMTILAHICRHSQRVRGSPPPGNPRGGISPAPGLDMLASDIWHAVMRHKATATMATLFAVGQDPRVDDALKTALIDGWRDNRMWLIMGVIQVRDYAMVKALPHGAYDASTLLRVAFTHGDPTLVRWLIERHCDASQNTGTLCGLSTTEVTHLALRWDSADHHWWYSWLASWGCEPAASDVARMLGRSPAVPGDNHDSARFVEAWPRQSVAIDDGSLVMALVCVHPARVGWGVRERIVEAVSPYAPSVSALLIDGMWRQAIFQFDRLIRDVRDSDGALPVSKALIWLCRKARRWGLLSERSISAFKIDDVVLSPSVDARPTVSVRLSHTGSRRAQLPASLLDAIVKHTDDKAAVGAKETILSMLDALDASQLLDEQASCVWGVRIGNRCA